jgi:uncharacterized protein with HEPN domain
MPPTLADRLQHVLEAIDDCQNILNERDQEAFARDRATRLAVERALEIISEASRHIPKELKERDATIAWRNIADLGNRLRHVYHRVDPNVLWDIVRRDLPALRLFLNQVIRDEQAK